MKKVKTIIISVFVLGILMLNVSVFVSEDGSSSTVFSVNQLRAFAGDDDELEPIDPIIPDNWTVCCGTTSDPRWKIVCAGDGNGCVPKPCS